MNQLIVRRLPLSDYETTWQFMKSFTQMRTPHTRDECWIVEHPAVFTQGQAGKPEHLLDPKDIPVVQSDRGGQITYHGPGQLIFYVLLDMKRRGLNLKTLTNALEQSVIALLKEFSIIGETLQNAPGVYVQNAKIASLGLKIRRGCCYHGLSLNIDMDLEPFRRINPCGNATLKMIQMRNFTDISIADLAKRFIAHLALRLEYNEIIEIIHNQDMALS